MKYYSTLIQGFFLVFLFNACSYQSEPADLVVHNGSIYTVDPAFAVYEAMAIRDGKIIELGAERAIMNKYDAKETMDLKKAYVYPGFIDGHCHFLAYGKGKNLASLYGTESWDEVIEKIQDYQEVNPYEYILGEGWDHNDWEVKEYPTNEILNELFPDIPVVLDRVDGHACIANDAALKVAGIDTEMKIDGGLIEQKEGVLTGILVDNAKSHIMKFFSQDSEEILRDAFVKAQSDCFAVGLTTVVDAGLDKHEIDLIQTMQDEGELKMRVYAMISDDPKNLDHYLPQGPLKTDRLSVRSVKVYADGALGSRGASLLAPYHDKPEEWGFLLSSFPHFDSLAQACSDAGFQMNTHCIGDSANRYISSLYAKYLGGTNDKRWRIEHAQVINDTDFDFFREYSIIPSVQPTHATSDMYWAGDRLGEERMHGAYAYQRLKEANGLIALGTDFPIEGISPIWTYFAATVRKDHKGYPEQGFQMEAALSREDALRGMTIWNAIASFEEAEKGSLEAGKWADFVVLDRDILKVSEDQILDTEVLNTYISGEAVYKK